MEELVNLGLCFIGLVKTVATKFPMNYLDSIELKGWGDCKVLATLDDDTQRNEMVTVLRVDENCHYFIGNSEGTAQVKPIYRTLAPIN